MEKQNRNELPDWVRIGHTAQCREDGRIGRISGIHQNKDYTPIRVEYDDERGKCGHSAPLEFFRDPDELQGLDDQLLVDALFDAVETLSEYRVDVVSIASRGDEGRIVLSCSRKSKEDAHGC